MCIFSGCMKSVGYRSILQMNLLPLITKVYPDGHCMWQDNDPKHTSNSTKKWMKDSGRNSVSEVGGQSFTNFRQHYIALLGLRLHIALRKPL